MSTTTPAVGAPRVAHGPLPIEKPVTRRTRVAIAGHGVVGSALVRALQQDERYDVVRVLVRDARRPRLLPFAAELLTDDVSAFLRTPADIVAEATGDVSAARVIARDVLQRGGRFITANKALVAQDGASLSALGDATRLQFDAAVGGGVPVIRLLRNVIARGSVREVSGILNGTSNFVLDQLGRGASLERALAEARRRGFAEADASRDLDGTDTADKIALIAWLAFAVPPHKARVDRIGLLPDPERLVRDARAAGGVVRLVGSAYATDGGIACAVEPVIVRAGSAFARTRGEGNRILVNAGWGSKLELAGPGAGGEATASAMMADIRLECAALPDGGPHPDAAPDPAEYRWSISAVDDPHTQSPFDAAGLPVKHCGIRNGFVRLHIEAATRAEVHAVVRTLRAIGAQPVVARLDLDGAA